MFGGWCKEKDRTLPAHVINLIEDLQKEYNCTLIILAVLMRQDKLAIDSIDSKTGHKSEPGEGLRPRIVSCD